MRLLRCLSFAFLACAFLCGQAVAHGAHATFAQWRSCGACAYSLNSEISVWVGRGARSALSVVLLELAQETRSLGTRTAEERRWAENLLRRLGFVLAAKEAQHLKGLFDPRPAGAFSDRNSFPPEPALGLESLDIADGEPGLAARRIWRCGLIAQALLAGALAPARAASLAAFRQARDRWQSFQANASADQFPWESFTNAALLPGTLAQPPTLQLRFLHPEIATLLSLRSRVAAPVLAVEVLGWRRFDPSSLEPTWGLSLFAASKPAEGRKEAFGLMLSFRDISLGLCAPQRIEGRRESQIIVGLKLTRLVNAKRDRFRQLKEGLDGVLHPSGPVP